MDRSEYEETRLAISFLNLLKNKNHKHLLIMDGYILKLSGGAMAYPKVAS